MKESGSSGSHFFCAIAPFGRLCLSFRKQFFHVPAKDFFYTRRMNQSMVRNLCRKAAVVGGKCADRHADSIASTVFSGDGALLRPIALVVMRAMVDRLASVFPGEFEVDSGIYRLHNGLGCFRFIPFLDLSNARRSGFSIGTVCSYHEATTLDAAQPLSAAAYLGDDIGVLHATAMEFVVRSNYRRIFRPYASHRGADVSLSPVLGIGTDVHWDEVPAPVKQLVPSLRLRPYVASPLLIVHALVVGSLDSAIIHTNDVHLRAIASFFLNQAMMPSHHLEFNGESLEVRGSVPAIVEQ